MKTSVGVSLGVNSLESELQTKNSFWKTKLFKAALVEFLMNALVYVVCEFFMQNKLFSLSIVTLFSIFSIYILGAWIGWYQVVLIRMASFVSIIDGILGYSSKFSFSVRILAFLLSVSIPIFLVTFLWSKRNNSLDKKDDGLEKKIISVTKAVSLICVFMFALAALFYLY